MKHQPQLFLFKLFMSTFLLFFFFFSNFTFSVLISIKYFPLDLWHVFDGRLHSKILGEVMMVSPTSYTCLTTQETYWQMADCVTPNWMGFSSIIEIMYLFFFSLIAAGSPASHLIFARIARLPVWALPWQHWFDLSGLGPLLKWRCVSCALLSTGQLRIKRRQKLLISPNVC